MSKQNQSVQNQDNNPLKEIQHELNTASDALSMRATCFDDLSTVFDAILHETEKHTHVHRLARLGQYLTNDWAGLCDCSSHDLKAAIEAVKNSEVK